MNERGFQISIFEHIEEEFQFQYDVRLFYVIDGKLCVEIDETNYLLEKEDVILVHCGTDKCRLSARRAIICEVSYENQMLLGVMGDLKGRFFCNSAVDTRRSYNELKNALKNLIYQRTIQSHKTTSYESSMVYQILDILVENFWTASRSLADNENSVDYKLQKIIQFVNQNYSVHISLAKVAEELFVSTSTLSRIFHKQTGVYFAEYVTEVRLKHVVSKLRYTDENVTRIAVDCGFSGAPALNKAFREKYQVSPTDYRKQLREEEVLKEESVRRLQDKILKETQASGNDAAKRVCEEIRVSESVPYKKNWNKTINIGSVFRLSEVNIQFQTLELVNGLGFSHIRLWNVFSKKLMITDGKTTGHYNYNQIDVIFDFLVSNHIHVFLDFGNRPDTVIKGEGVALFYEQECIEFESKRIWGASVKDLILHLLKRYGKEELEQWVFELTYNVVKTEVQCYKDENFQYIEAFKLFYQIIKQELPNACVGGYSALLGDGREFFRSFLKNCKKERCIPDYVSIILFPYEQVRQDKKYIYKRNQEKNLELHEIAAYKKILEEESAEDCKLIITEWNSSLSSRNYMNDSCFRSTYLVKKISEIWDSVDMVCFWVGSDWISSYYDTRGIVNGGAGIITMDNIKKPVWYAFSFLNSLGEELISKGENYILTKKEDNSFILLCFNYKEFGYNYFLQNEDDIDLMRIAELFEDTGQMELELKLTRLERDCNYIVKKRQVNSEYGCVLTEWMKFDCAVNLDRSDIKYIQAMSIPHMERYTISSNDHTLTLSTEMRDQEIALFHIYKER